MFPTISIVICTVPERKDYLFKCISSLDAIKGIGPSEILLIVDKNTKLDSLPVCRWPVRVIEAGRSLSGKRNKGVYESKSDYIAFIDDDVIVTPGWLDAAVKRLSGEKLDVLSGQAQPIFEAEVPLWLKGRERIVGGFNCLGPGSKIHETPIGCNIFMNVDKLKKIGAFNLKLGRGSGFIEVREETELMYRIKTNDKIPFEADALVYHHIQAHRLNHQYILSRYKEIGQVDAYCHFIHCSWWWKESIKNFLTWAGAFFCFDRGKASEKNLARIVSSSYFRTACQLFIYKYLFGWKIKA